MTVEGGKAREYKIPTETFSLPFMGGLRWMPDSSGLGFFTPGKKGATLFRFTLASEKWETWDIKAPGWARIEWSPSGEAIIYSKGILGMFERVLETGEERSLYRPEKEKNVVSMLRDLRFSRDYKTLAFHRSDIKFENNKAEEVRENIVVIDMSTEKARKIDTEGFNNLYWSTAWSADGKNLVIFNETKDKTQEMFIIPLEGRNPNKVELTGVPINNGCYITDWSPDGKYIAFEIKRSTYEVYMMKNIIPEVDEASKRLAALKDQ
jgi:hypothetical protein